MMTDTHKAPARQRLKEILIDWLCILAFLLLLYGFFAAFYRLVFHVSVLPLTEPASQALVTVVSVAPVIVAFAWLDLKKGGSIGKQKCNLTVRFQKAGFGRSILRNTIKFLPWQFGHMGTIHMIHTGFEYDLFAMAFHYAAIFMALALLGMGLLRKDGRHLGDLLAGTQVVPKEL